MSRGAEVVGPGPTLSELARSIHLHHDRVRDAAESAIEHLLAIGRDLLAARSELVSDQAFGEWFRAQEFAFSRRWAWTLRAAAEREPEIRAVVGSQLPTGSVNIEAALKELRAGDSAARREMSRSAPVLADSTDLREGDAREVLTDVDEESVALVLTDPPYGDDAEPLYEWLAEWSAQVLVPGGSLVCYTGQSRLDRDIRIFGEQLRYWWCLAMPHHQSQRLAGKFVIAEWKPVLWFVKDNRRGRSLVPDLLRSPARAKADHRWGQGEGGVGPLIEHLSEPGELICDPFAGTATWGQIAAGMGRRWIGADIKVGGTERVVA